jgi:hypothetical protein
LVLAQVSGVTPDLLRIRAELQDLKYKQGYSARFKVTCRRDDYSLTAPTLHIRFQRQWYKYRLDLSGYPEKITGHFLGALPPCPKHGGKHPHVFDNATFCWQIENNWVPAMTLAEDYIPFIFKTLENPQHHFGCGY